MTGEEIFYESPERFLKLYLRYKKQNEKGVANGHLFFNKSQVIEDAVAMSLWHMEKYPKT